MTAGCCCCWWWCRFDVASPVMEGGAAGHSVDLAYTLGALPFWRLMLPPDQHENRRQARAHTGQTIHQTSQRLASSRSSTVDDGRVVVPACHVIARLHELWSHALASFAWTGRPHVSLPRPESAGKDGTSSAGTLARLTDDVTSEQSDWPPVVPSSPHPVLVLDVPVGRCRVDRVDLQAQLPNNWAAARRRRRPLFWVDEPPKDHK